MTNRPAPRRPSVTRLPVRTSRGRPRHRLRAALIGPMIVVALAGCTRDGSGPTPSGATGKAGAVQSADLNRSTVVLDPSAEQPPMTEPTPVLAEIAADPVAAKALPQVKKVSAVRSCGDLTSMVTANYGALLRDLGAAQRTDTEAIDRAMEAYGAVGQLIAARAAELECDTDQRDTAICSGVSGLSAGGAAGRDIVDLLRSICS